MANVENEAARVHRLIALAAVAALALSTALAFGRVFQGREATLKLLAAAALSVGLAAVTERRGLLLATLASAALLVLALTWLVFPHTAWYGLTSSETFASLGRAMQKVGHQASVQVAPTAPLQPLLLAAITAVWTATFSAHALAVRAGSPLLAMMPPLALMGFADSVLEDGARPGYALLFLLAVLVIVFADGLRRVRLWGPIWPSPGLRRRKIALATTRGARRVAALALGTSLLLPGLLPGFRSQALVDLSTSGGEDVFIDPFVRVAAQLRQDEPTTLFEVRSPKPSYWRMLALDDFDAQTGTWETANPDLSYAPTYSSGTLLPPPAGITGLTLRQDVRLVSDLGFRWVPSAYPAASISMPGASVRYDPELGSAVSTEPLAAGTEYTVESRPPIPTRGQLDAEVFASPSSYGMDVVVPGDLAPDLRRVAEAWAGDPQAPAFERIWALQEHLRDPAEFTYDDTVKPIDDGQALLRFLTVDKRGFCQQYASAMALLVRSLGYPARVVVGFTQGTLKEPGLYVVTNKEAHSWVEVRFPTYGWLAFEPTPTRSNPTANAYLRPPVGAAPGERGQLGGALNGADGALPAPQLRNVYGFRGRVKGPGGPGGGATPLLPLPEEGFRIPYGLISLVLLVLTVLLLLVFPPVKAIARRARLGRAGREPEHAILAAYRVFDDRAADLGLGRRRGETPEEYRRRLHSQVRFSDGHLDRLTAAASLAAYAGEPVTQEMAAAAKADAQVAIRDVRRSSGTLKRLLGLYRPSI